MGAKSERKTFSLPPLDCTRAVARRWEPNMKNEAHLQLEAEYITIAYERMTVVENVSIAIEAGDYVSIVGENGSGKSSLLKGILGLIPLKSGEVRFLNGISKKNIGYLPQQTLTQKEFPASVYEVVLSGCLTRRSFHPFYSQTDKNMAKHNMEKLGIMDLRKKTFGNLSGGQKQRVLLARALCATDKILFLDEPISGLDPIVTAEFYEIIDKLNKEDHLTIVMVSHDIENALKYSNKILHMKEFEYFYGTKEVYMQSEQGKAFLKESE